MFNKLEFFIAMRYLLSKRREGFISVTAIFSFFGIMIGVATLIIVMSVMNGFRHDLLDRIIGINSHITIYAKANDIDNYDDVIKKISQIKGISYVNPIVENKAMISTSNRSNGGLIKGIKMHDLKNKKIIYDNILAGNAEKLSNKNYVMVGSYLASNLGIKPDSDIKLIAAQTSNTLFGAIPRIKTYKVAAIFESGMYEYDSTTIFMNFEMSQIHFNSKNKATAIEIFVDDLENIDAIKLEIFNNIKDYKNLYFVDWKQSNASFIEALKVESTVMFLILTLIILVAAFNIISSMIMLVKDKTKNIALLRTLGMKKGSIMRIFLICGSSIGFLGTIFGLILGVLFSINIQSIKAFLENATNTTLFNPTIYFLSTLPSKILISDVILIVGMSLTISFLSTIYPAYKASKSNPADILRYE